MSHLILHIGLHKTGTTSLQNTCFARADDLAKHGLIYPRFRTPLAPQGVEAHHGLTLNIAHHFGHFCLRNGPEVGWAQIIRAYAGGDKTVLISSEEFSIGRAGMQVDMARLGDIARAFGKVTVVCVLRDQVALLQSVYMQVTSMGQGYDVGALLHGAMVQNDAARLSPDWRPLYDRLLQGFAPQQLHFIDYDAARASAGGVIGAVLALGGVTFRQGAASQRANVSNPPLAHYLCHRATGPNAPSAGDVIAVQAQIAAYFGAGRPTTLFTRAEVAAIRTHFAAPNAELVARLRRVQPDFALTRAALPDAMIYREDVLPVAAGLLAKAGVAVTSANAFR